MSALISKGISKLTPGDHIDLSELPLNDTSIIRALDYEELEEKYQIQKYYPRFIHNYDYSTPQIKEMIQDKPIYAKANRHKKRATSETKKRATEFDLITGEAIGLDKSKKDLKVFERGLRKELKRDQINEQKLQRKEHREHRKEQFEDRKSLKEQHRQEMKDEREESRRILREHLSKRKKAAYVPAPFLPAYQPRDHTEAQPGDQKMEGSKTRTDLLFRNPFDSTQSTLVAATSALGTHLGSGGKTKVASDAPEARKPSISCRLRDLLLGKSSTQKVNTVLKRTKSFDQTKADMTTERDAKNNIFRLVESKGRRMSEAMRTYFFFLFNQTLGKTGGILE